MHIVNASPPNIDKIKAVLNIDGKKVIFAYGDKIYNPSHIKIEQPLLDHEAIHGRQQGSDPDAWWDLYLNDPEFRLQQEIPAHVAEYRSMIQNGNRADRRRALKLVAGKLASNLYGGLITKAHAKNLLVKHHQGKAK